MSVRSKPVRLVGNDFAFTDGDETPSNLRFGDKFQAYIMSGSPAGTDTPQLVIGRVFDVMPDAVLLLDADGKVAGWNKAALALLGCDEFDILGRGIDAFWEPELGKPQ